MRWDGWSQGQTHWLHGKKTISLGSANILTGGHSCCSYNPPVYHDTINPLPAFYLAMNFSEWQEGDLEDIVRFRGTFFISELPRKVNQPFAFSQELLIFNLSIKGQKIRRDGPAICYVSPTLTDHSCSEECLSMAWLGPKQFKRPSVALKRVRNDFLRTAIL